MMRTTFPCAEALAATNPSKVAIPIFNAAKIPIANYLRGAGIEVIAKNARLWGGNLIRTVNNRTTTVLGRFKGGIEYVKATGKWRCGQNTGGINLLNVGDDAYRQVIAEGGDDLFWNTYNKPWLDDAINRGDNIRIVSDPTDPANLFKNGVDGERTMFGREIEHLENKGYTFEGGEAVLKREAQTN